MTVDSSDSPAVDPTRRYTRPESSTSAALARYATDFTRSMVTLATPTELARQLSKRRRQIIALGLLVGSVILIVWAITRDTLPETIVIAVGPEKGQYNRVGQHLRSKLQSSIDPLGTTHTVRTDVDESAGSINNYEKLMTGEAHLAIIQADALTVLRDKGRDVAVEAVAPLYREFVMVIVRLGDDGQPLVKSIADLRGRKVAIGRPGSGMAATADRLLREYYGIDSTTDLVEPDVSFSVLADGSLGYDAAVVVSGADNPGLRDVLATGSFDLLPIDLAATIARKEPFLSMNEETTITVGMLCPLPRVPSQPVPTVATTAVLMVCAHDARLSDDEAAAMRTAGVPEPEIQRIRDERSRDRRQLVTYALSALYDDETNTHSGAFGFLMKSREVRGWDDIKPHPAVSAYFEPYESLGFIANAMESLVGIKELIIGFILIIWASRFTWRWLKSRKTAKALELQQRQLDTYMQQTVDLERQVAGTEDQLSLKLLLGQANTLKFSALDSLTHEELRSDQRFLIFIMQCAQLIEHIRSRLAGIGVSIVGPLQEARPDDEEAAGGQRAAASVDSSKPNKATVDASNNGSSPYVTPGWDVAAEVLASRLLARGHLGDVPATRKRVRKRALRRYEGRRR